MCASLLCSLFIAILVTVGATCAVIEQMCACVFARVTGAHNSSLSCMHEKVSVSGIITVVTLCLSIAVFVSVSVSCRNRLDIHR